MQRLLLIDGFSIVRRVFEAVPGDDTPEKAAGSLKSSWGSILRAIKETSPTHFLAVFDAGGDTWRHRLYQEYKAARKPMSEHLRDALPAFFEGMQDHGLRTLQVKDVEADDTMATIAIKAISRGFEVVIATTDKDMCRLIHDGVRIRDHFTPAWRDEAYVQKKFGIPSRLMGDMLALMGDETDGIPGIFGVGPKTAAKLLNEYGGLDAVLAAASTDLDPLKCEIKGAVGEKLREQAGLARLSRDLATLKLDVPIGLTPNELRLPASMLKIAEAGETARSRAEAAPVSYVPASVFPASIDPGATAAATQHRRARM